jgi:hypothetical protein
MIGLPFSHAPAQLRQQVYDAVDVAATRLNDIAHSGPGPQQCVEFMPGNVEALKAYLAECVRIVYAPKCDGWVVMAVNDEIFELWVYSDDSAVCEVLHDLQDLLPGGFLVAGSIQARHVRNMVVKAELCMCWKECYAQRPGYVSHECAAAFVPKGNHAFTGPTCTLHFPGQDKPSECTIVTGTWPQPIKCVLPEPIMLRLHQPQPLCAHATFASGQTSRVWVPHRNMGPLRLGPWMAFAWFTIPKDAVDVWQQPVVWDWIRRQSAARAIQQAWRRAVSSPEYRVCRKRLASEFAQLVV